MAEEESPMMGSGDQPLAVGRFFQAPADAPQVMRDGRRTEPHKLYLRGLFPGIDQPVIFAGPFRSDYEAEQAMRRIVLQPAPHPRPGGGRDGER